MTSPCRFTRDACALRTLFLLEAFAVSARYAGKPARIYFIGEDGQVLYDPGIGPFGFSPYELETVIAAYLAKGAQALHLSGDIGHSRIGQESSR